MDGIERATRRAMIGGLGAAALAAIPSSAMAEGTPAPGDPEQMRVVWHVGEAGGWAPALSNLKNMTGLHPDGAFRLVVDGTAVYSIAGASDLYPRIEELAGAGVGVFICPNALKEHGIAPSQLPVYMDTAVPGVEALVQASREGFVYVKP